MSEIEEMEIAIIIGDSLRTIAEELMIIREMMQEDRKAEIKTNAKVFMNKLYCECGARMTKKEHLSINPPLYQWHCNECGGTYRSHKLEGF